MGANVLQKCGSRTKKWNPVFSEERRVADRAFEETHRMAGSKRSLIEAFLEENCGPVPSLQVERGRIFFSSNHRDILTWSAPARAWVYRHTNSEHIVRAGASHMTALQLAELVLSKQGINVFQPADVNRTLVHIEQPTLDHAMALIRTVSRNNVAALRAALLGHIARIAALRVTIPPKGFATFRMEFHLPYLALRKVQCGSESSHIGHSQRDMKVWTDLTFLDHHISELDLKGRAIYAAHATVVVSGWECSKYTAYSFVDPGPTANRARDEEQAGESDDDDDDDDEDSDDYSKLDSVLLPEDAEDEFAAYGRQDCLHLHDSFSSWDPRVRFLRAVQTQVTVALQEYDYLIGCLCDVTTKIEDNLFPATSIPDSHNSEIDTSQQDLPECVRRITTLLVKLREHLSETVRVWTKFSDRHGDIAYFSDLSTEAIDSMREIFIDLLGFEHKISSMEETWKIWARTLDTTLSQESNTITREGLQSSVVAVKLSKRMTDIAAVTFRAAEETSRITHMSVYLVLATTPFIIALQYFTSDQPLFPFERNLRTFFVSILILMPLLFVFALTLYGFDTYKWALFWKVYAMLGGKKRPPKKHLSDIAAEILRPDHGEDSATPSSTLV